MHKPLMPVLVEEVCFTCGESLESFTEETGGYNYVCANGHNNLLQVKNRTVNYIDALFYSSNEGNLPVLKLHARSPTVEPIAGRYTIYFPLCGTVWNYALLIDCQKDYEKIVVELRQLGLHK